MFEQIEELAYRDARSLEGTSNVALFLKSWWSHKYTRPLKDPLLSEYTIEELAYEYYNSIEREKAAKERIQEENDKIEEVKLQADDKWAEEMEAEELKAEELSRQSVKELNDPSKDPSNIEWMERTIQEEKKRLGDDFGEDIVMNFGDDK